MKRGESGLSLLVAIDKPTGMTSHDAVNRARRIFGERRVGHTGTLDPLASGVLPLCIGPATRLDKYMTGHTKRYRVEIAFGCETTTDDSEGEPTSRGKAPLDVFDEDFARAFLVTILGEHEQVPPRYSAIKVNGKKAYEVARRGGDADLEPRHIEIYEADLVDCLTCKNTGQPIWRVDFTVSKGTYIRSLARDIGRAVGCPAHVGALRRLSAGSITISDCISLETLEQLGTRAALDPVAVLGFRFAYADDFEKIVSSGAKLPADAMVLYDCPEMTMAAGMDLCTSRVVASRDTPYDGEYASIVLGNKLKAIYAYAAAEAAWKPTCVFSTAIMRV